MTDSGRTIGLLARWKDGDRAALDQIVEMMYRQIHQIAARAARGERSLSIEPTALVNEMYLRLVNLNQIDWQDRVHFLSMCARLMRQTLVDEARKRRAAKRDGGLEVTLTDERGGLVTSGFGVLEIDELLSGLQSIDAAAAEIVELRVFGGLSIEEAAAKLALSESTVSRKWRASKAWLARHLTNAIPAS